jgi:heme A synthase
MPRHLLLLAVIDAHHCVAIHAAAAWAWLHGMLGDADDGSLVSISSRSRKSSTAVCWVDVLGVAYLASSLLAAAICSTGRSLARCDADTETTQFELHNANDTAGSHSGPDCLQFTIPNTDSI